MARKKINVSAAIKEYLTANPTAGPTEAAKAISGIVGKKVPASYVSNVKFTLAKGAGKKKRRGPKARMKRAAAAMNGSIELAALLAMKELIAKCGADACHKMIDVLA